MLIFADTLSILYQYHKIGDVSPDSYLPLMLVHSHRYAWSEHRDSRDIKLSCYARPVTRRAGEKHHYVTRNHYCLLVFLIFP
jgi:hypothetical protein